MPQPGKLIFLPGAVAAGLAASVFCCIGDCSSARAELSQKFLHNLQKQYENGYIPDPPKEMSYEEKLAIRKKQQKLAEDQRKKAAEAVVPPPPPREEPRCRPHDRSDSYREQTYEMTYRYCRNRWGGDEWAFSRCMEENLYPP